MTAANQSVLTRFDADTGVLTVAFNRPEARNALNPDMVSALLALFAGLRDRPEVRVVLMRSRGGHFCAGADLKGVFADAASQPAPGEADPIATMNRGFGELLRAAEAIPQVLVTVCEGGVLGGGFGLACVSDIAFAHEATKFGMPETSRGLPPAQIAPFVVQRIGLTQARRLVLTSAQFDGREALRLGLVHEVFADEATLADGLARVLTEVLRCAPSANARTKAIVLSVGLVDPDAVLDQAADHFAACARGPEAPEGIGAFMQKRAAAWARVITPADIPRLLSLLTEQEPKA
ncbi:enoyl-CoA hydratase/isomerase family protein [Amnimonas aquatica]|uniref:Enoyl-CoA hydratase n=1 Tax=Amnimonas aquatica TaxID=2094561 RepID=A0A2P6AU24_9GAMM|nr:enoyl-CoA hydratase-related protein [Amnimonas aquatica]PQA48591.1 enoyl-CoA hydratase [Amnimonas aquatica]